MQDRRSTPLASTCEAPHACPLPVRLAVLSRTPYFSGLDGETIRSIDDHMLVRGYHEGEQVYRAGDDATRLFVLATGQVKVIRPSLGGQDVLVDVLTAGSPFGTLTTLGEAVYSDTAEAMTVSCALSISAEDFREVVSSHPSVALAALDDLAHRLEAARESVRRLSGGTVEQRVAATLLTLVDKLGEPRDGSILLQLPLTRADLAAMTGSTTESVSRVMSRFKRDGVIDSGRRWTSVLDRDRLAALGTS